MKYNFYITSSFEIKEPYFLYIGKLDRLSYLYGVVNANNIVDKSLFA